MKEMGGDISYIGGITCARTASEDAADATESVGDARPGVPYGGEHPRVLVGGNDWPLPRLVVLAGKNIAGVRRDIVRLTNGYTSLGAILEDNQARFTVGLEHGRPLSGTWFWSVTRRSTGNLNDVELDGCRYILPMNSWRVYLLPRLILLPR